MRRRTFMSVPLISPIKFCKLTLGIKLQNRWGNFRCQLTSKVGQFCMLINRFINNGKSSPLHSYLIQNGSCNLEPVLYNSLREMDSKEGMKKIKKKQKQFQVSSNDVLVLNSKLNQIKDE